MKKTTYLFVPLLTITVFLVLVHVIVSNMLSTAGVELDILQTKLTETQKQNIIIREQVLTDTSLRHIASSAADMGFVKAKTNIYLPDQLPLAKR